MRTNFTFLVYAHESKNEVEGRVSQLASKLTSTQGERWAMKGLKVDSRIEHLEQSLEQTLEFMHSRVDNLLSIIHNDNEQKDTEDSSSGQVTEDSKNDLPLHSAARAGDGAAVQVLLQEGVDAYAQNKRGESPLEIAAAGGYAEVLQFLLQHSYDDKERPMSVAARDQLAQALCVAANSNVARLLITKVGQKVLADAMRQAAQDGRVEVLRTLLEIGVSANKVDENGWSALHLAANAGHVNSMKVLLQFGAKSGYVAGKLLQTPLHAAATKGHAACMDVLVERGQVDINFRDSNGSTALHLAVCATSPECVKVLLKRNINVALCNKYGETALHKAACLHPTESSTADSPVLLTQRQEILKMLLDAGADPNAKSEDARTAFDMDGAEALRQVMAEKIYSPKNFSATLHT